MAAGSSLTASLRGIKLKVVYVNLDRPLYRLLTWRDDIRKVTDLRGKGIGVASRGDTMEGSANLLLRKYGMDPVRDVIWVALGTGGRVSSLIAKTVDSAVLLCIEWILSAQSEKVAMQAKDRVVCGAFARV